MAEPGIVQTETLSLNKPDSGYFNWADVINENWDKLDRLGGGLLPLLTPMEFRHKLEGDDAIGWAMQGSVLDGDDYTTLWDYVWAARQRASLATNQQIKGVTYTWYQDSTTGLVFVDAENYQKGVDNLGDSLGMICTLSGETKTIRLPLDSSFQQPLIDATQLPGGYVPAGLPNITGSVTKVLTSKSREGAGSFSIVDTGDEGIQGGSGAFDYVTLDFDASDSEEIFGSSDTVQPKAHLVYRYYKVGNTIVGSQQIDLGNLLSELAEVRTDLSTLEYEFEQLEGKAQSYYNWDGYLNLGTGGSVYEAPSAGMLGLYRATMTDGEFTATIRANESSSSAIVGAVSSAYKYSNGGSAWIPVAAGEKHYITGAGYCTRFFVPAK